jgi:ubiquinone/menaquinone biosynthesis C-methylase UbiE
VPILIDDQRSAFSISDFIGRSSTTFRPLSSAEKLFSSLIPSLTRNWMAKRNYRTFAKLLGGYSRRPEILVVGCGELGNGLEELAERDDLELITTDVSLGSFVQFICDSHDLPFEDRCFDGVVIQAVLEHVADPFRTVEEIHRVLRSGGVVYAETPFMQQVHAGAYDFTRFTHLGHRRLFRRFAELESGAVVGPGTALAWSYQYFLLSFFNGSLTRMAVKAFTRLTGFWLKYFDLLIMHKSAAMDAASGFYFIGQKQETVLSDRELVQLYRGAVRKLPLRKFR